LEEVPAPLLEELGTSKARVGTTRVGAGDSPARSRSDEHTSAHYSYEDEDQSASWHGHGAPAAQSRQKPTAPARPYNSIENIAEFFASRGKKFSVPKTK